MKNKLQYRKISDYYITNIELVRMKGLEGWNTNFFNFNTIYGGYEHSSTLNVVSY